jgi:hypothetical protein
MSITSECLLSEQSVIRPNWAALAIGGRNGTT